MRMDAEDGRGAHRDWKQGSGRGCPGYMSGGNTAHRRGGRPGSVAGQVREPTRGSGRPRGVDISLPVAPPADFTLRDPRRVRPLVSNKTPCCWWSHQRCTMCSGPEGQAQNQNWIYVNCYLMGSCCSDHRTFSFGPPFELGLPAAYNYSARGPYEKRGPEKTSVVH